MTKITKKQSSSITTFKKNETATTKRQTVIEAEEIYANTGKMK